MESGTQEEVQQKEQIGFEPVGFVEVSREKQEVVSQAC